MYTVNLSVKLLVIFRLKQDAIEKFLASFNILTTNAKQSA